VAAEQLESVAPEPPIGREPSFELEQRFRTKPIDSALCVDFDVHHARGFEHAKVFRDGGLVHAECVDELADGPRIGAQQIEDPAAIGFSDDFEGGEHVLHMLQKTYACQGIYKHRIGAASPSRAKLPSELFRHGRSECVDFVLPVTAHHGDA
jgi:hypothetical protein